MTSYTIYDYARLVGYAFWPVLVLGGVWAVVSAVRAAKSARERSRREAKRNLPGEPIEYVNIANMAKSGRDWIA